METSTDDDDDDYDDDDLAVWIPSTS